MTRRAPFRQAAELTTDEYRAIVVYLSSAGHESRTCRQIAQGCGTYDTHGGWWASARIHHLINRGMVDRVSRGLYRITDAGRLAASVAVDDISRAARGGG